MTSNTKTEAGASLLTTEQIDAIRERFHQWDMPSRGLVQRIASLITLSLPAPQADAAPSLPRYTEWLHLRTHGQWSDGVPEWARDHDGRMNDVTAANAVIEELADAAIAAGGAQEPDVFEWIETELSAISCRYHGDPSYDHDAHWMKNRALKLIADARKAFPLPRVAATVGLTDEQREAIEWAAGRAHVEALGKPIDGAEGKRWRLLSDMFRAAASNGEQA